jgi:hypothetical protein
MNENIMKIRVHILECIQCSHSIMRTLFFHNIFIHGDVGLELNKIATHKIGCEQYSDSRMLGGYFGDFGGG